MPFYAARPGSGFGPHERLAAGLRTEDGPGAGCPGIAENGEGGGESMRLDKFLKVSRLIKRRTVANEACDAGRVMVNGRPAKASVQVKQGDVIEIGFGTKTVKVEVVDVQETTKKEQAKDLFKYL